MLLRQPTPQEAADIVAIQALAVSYSEAICRRAVDEAVLVYTDDGVLRSPISEDAVGHEAIAALIQGAIRRLEFVFQTAHPGLIRVEGDQARARFPITEWSLRDDGNSMVFLGVYDDDLVRTSDGWRFRARMLHPCTLGKQSLFNGKIHSLAVLGSEM